MQTELPPDRRSERNERREVNFAALALRSNGAVVPVRLLNLSYDGCQLATESHLAVGERVKLGLAGLGEMMVEVRWASRDKAGARFVLEQPLLAEKQRHSVVRGHDQQDE